MTPTIDLLAIANKLRDELQREFRNTTAMPDGYPADLILARCRYSLIFAYRDIELLTGIAMAIVDEQAALSADFIANKQGAH